MSWRRWRRRRSRRRNSVRVEGRGTRKVAIVRCIGRCLLSLRLPVSNPYIGVVTSPSRACCSVASAQTGLICKPMSGTLVRSSLRRVLGLVPGSFGIAGSTECLPGLCTALGIRVGRSRTESLRRLVGKPRSSRRGCWITGVACVVCVATVGGLRSRLSLVVGLGGRSRRGRIVGASESVSHGIVGPNGVGIDARLPSLCIVPCALFWVGQDLVRGLDLLELLLEDFFLARIAVGVVESR